MGQKNFSWSQRGYKSIWYYWGYNTSLVQIRLFQIHQPIEDELFVLVIACSLTQVHFNVFKLFFSLGICLYSKIQLLHMFLNPN